MKKYFLYMAAAAFLMTACDKEPLLEDPPEEVPVTGVTLNLPDALLLVGGTLTLEATIEPGNATNETVTWSSDDDSVATVSPEGEVTAVASGTATITVTTDDGGFTATCTVTVEKEEELPVPVTGVTLNLPDALLKVGGTLNLEATVEPNNATNQGITWSSDDDSVVTVSSEGEVTAEAPGTAKITATTDDGGFTAACSVTVKVTSIITMTTQASEVEIGMLIYNETGDIMVNWGDGESCNFLDAVYNLYSGIKAGPIIPNYIHHSYSGASEHLITITGSDSIWMFVCANNQLTTLDVSGYPSLLELTCTNNQLTDLDLSHNTALTRLDCGYNQITTLDVSHNTALTHLFCHGNQLTTLDLSHNTAALTYLFCPGNQLKTLDLSHNTALSTLFCCNNQLTTLDLSHNIALARLYCSDNQLATLDVSSNALLWILDCYNNQLTASVLNGLFSTLIYKTDFIRFIYIDGNPGENDCDVSIAETNGYIVNYETFLCFQREHYCNCRFFSSP